MSATESDAKFRRGRAAIERFGRTEATCRCTYTASATAMQEAEAVALHSSLSAAAAARRRRPRLRRRQIEKGEEDEGGKELMTSKHSTAENLATRPHRPSRRSLGPWARPVEFKMKEVNRRRRSLHDVCERRRQGNTLKNSPVVTPPAASSSAAAADKAFNWKKAIKEALRAAPGGELKLKRLRQAVLSEHAKQTKAGDAESGDNAKAAFKKRLKKMDGVSVSGKLVKLAPKS